MSTVFGIYRLNGEPVCAAHVEQMAEVLAQRGRGPGKTWVDGPVGLGHRAFMTTAGSLLESHPLFARGEDLVLVANARIDNRAELIAALGLDGRPEAEVSDGEIILGAYERWGEDCAVKLLGDFSFAIWDRSKRLVFCARDHFGVKPFYYHASGRVFVFASEIKALLCLEEVPRRINEARILDYLSSNFDDKVITFYEGILRLPPAHCMVAGPGGVRVRRYWSLDPSREVHLASDEEYAEAFRALFQDAVRCRLRSVFPVGSLLSGGLDSSSISCVARDILLEQEKTPLRTFSLIFDDAPQADERSFLAAVLRQHGMEPHYVRGDQLSPLADLESLLDCEEEPFYAPNLFLHWGLYKAASAEGVRVLLDGVDGDITVSHGIGHLADLGRRGRWGTLSREISGLSRNFERSPRRIFLNHVVKPLLPGRLASLLRLLRGGSGASATIMNAEFMKRPDLSARIRAVRAAPRRQASTARGQHYLGLTGGIIPFTLEIADRAAASFSIEPRYPFFDRRLAEFCLAIPAEQKIHRGWTRMVMRRAMAGILPREVQWRGGKADLSPSFLRGLASRDDLLKDCELVDNYIDVPSLRRAYRGLRRGNTENALLIWKVLILGLWLRRESCERGVEARVCRQRWMENRG